MPRTKLGQSNPWLSTASLLQKLDVSDDHLFRQIENGSFKLGEHFLIISSPNQSRRTHLWNYEAIVKLWSRDPAQR